MIADNAPNAKKVSKKKPRNNEKSGIGHRMTLRTAHNERSAKASTAIEITFFFFFFFMSFFFFIFHSNPFIRRPVDSLRSTLTLERSTLLFYSFIKLEPSLFFWVRWLVLFFFLLTVATICDPVDNTTNKHDRRMERKSVGGGGQRLLNAFLQKKKKEKEEEE